MVLFGKEAVSQIVNLAVEGRSGGVKWPWWGRNEMLRVFIETSNLSSTAQGIGWTEDASFRDKGALQEYGQEVWYSGRKKKGQ